MFLILLFFITYALSTSPPTSNTSGQRQMLSKVKEHQRKCEGKLGQKNSTRVPGKLDSSLIVPKNVVQLPVKQPTQQSPPAVLAVVSLPNMVIQIVSKIVNGNDAQPGEYPYMVSLRYKPYAEHYCGGTLVTVQHVLTAAHCVSDLLSPEEIYVVSESVSSVEGGEVHDIQEIRIHEEYIGDANYWKHDIAVLKLMTPVELNEYRKLIKLPTKEPPPGATCIVVGWGYVQSWQQTPSTILQTLDQIIVDQTECQNVYSTIASIVDNHLCAFLGKGYGACGGDSGGPLVCNGEQQGIVSFSSGCDHGYPSVYTKVILYIDWIQKNIEDVDSA